MTNSADPDQTAPREQSDIGLHSFVRPICPGFHTVYNILKVMQNIPRKKVFDMVSCG